MKVASKLTENELKVLSYEISFLNTELHQAGEAATIAVVRIEAAKKRLIELAKTIEEFRP